MQSIKSLVEKRKPRPVVNRADWQLSAVEAITTLSNGSKYKGSIFRCFKENHMRAKIALSDSIELGKPYPPYFFKVYNELKKKVQEE